MGVGVGVGVGVRVCVSNCVRVRVRVCVCVCVDNLFSCSGALQWNLDGIRCNPNKPDKSIELEVCLRSWLLLWC